MKYGTLVYGETIDGGSGLPYGTSTTDAVDNLMWIVSVDWDGDGVLDSANEAINMIDFDSVRGRDDYIKLGSAGEAVGFEPVQVGTATLTFDDTSRRYDPYNTTSPLYPNVRPGRLIKIRIRYLNVINQIKDIFTGKISDIKLQTLGNERRVIIECVDGMSLLKKTETGITINQNVSTATAIGLVLDEVNYPSLWGRAIDVTGDSLAFWWSDRVADTEISDLASAELGTFFIARDGKATYFSRSHTNPPQFNLTQSLMQKEIFQPFPWEVVRNKIKVTANPRRAAATGILWTLPDKPLLLAGTSTELWATYQYDNTRTPAINVGISSSDYTANTAEDGSGVDKSADFTFTLTDFGETGKIVIANTGLSDAYITLAQVHGDAIYSPGSVFSLSENATSQALYDVLQLSLDSRWTQTSTQASNSSAYLISFLATPQKFINVRLENQRDYQYFMDLFSTITVTAPNLDISGDFRIGKISHKWRRENGQDVITTWNLEPFPDNSIYWQFTAVFGTNTIFGL